MTSFKTPKGTELPLLNLKGKSYLQVAHRLVWFREELPDWSIETSLNSGPGDCLAQATIKDSRGRIRAMAHKYENSDGFADYREKAETGAVGRALAMVGYGTQFTDDLDEGSRLADSPVSHGPIISHAFTQDSFKPVRPAVVGDSGDYIVPFGKKYKGFPIKSIPRAEIEGYLSWLYDEAHKKGKPVGHEVETLKTAVESFYSPAKNQTDDIPF